MHARYDVTEQDLTDSLVTWSQGDTQRVHLLDPDERERLELGLTRITG